MASRRLIEVFVKNDLATGVTSQKSAAEVKGVPTSISRAKVFHRAKGIQRATLVLSATIPKTKLRWNLLH